MHNLQLTIYNLQKKLRFIWGVFSRFLSLKTKNYKLKTNFGFTLIEMMVAVSIFTIVAMVAISALISVNDANKKAQVMRAVLDNLNFALENMARNLRVGSNYYCSDGASPSTIPTTPVAAHDCASLGEGAIAFYDYNGNWVAYRLNDTGQIERSVSGGAFMPLTPYNSTPGITFQPLVINNLKFFVTGTAAGDGKQPRVVIIVSGIASYNSEIQSTFKIETSVSERRIDS